MPPRIPHAAPSARKSLLPLETQNSLIPYLLFRRSVKDNFFLLRFDDTHVASKFPKLTGQIQEELSWLGIEPQRIFSQSLKRHQDLYRKLLILLRRYGYVVKDNNGNLVLDWEHPELRFGAWLDLQRGPVVHHAPPLVFNKKIRRRELGSLVLARSEDGRVRLAYKFCGIVDDLLLSTHVVRDVRQRENSLTTRQSLIAVAIHRAWLNADKSMEAKAIKEEIEHLRRELVPNAKPLPPMVPPVYIHVSLVRERDTIGQDGCRSQGHILKKRATLRPMPYYFIEAARHDDRRLPETIVSYVLSSIVPNGARSLVAHRRLLGEMAGELGVPTLLDIVASKASLNWFRCKSKDFQISKAEVDAQERHVLRGLTYFHFLRSINEYCEQEGCRVPAKSVLVALYKNRSECASWREVVAIATFDREGQEYDPSLLSAFQETIAHCDSRTFVEEFRRRLDAGTDIHEACQKVRIALTGLPSGIPLHMLADLIGLRGGIEEK